MEVQLVIQEIQLVVEHRNRECMVIAKTFCMKVFVTLLMFQDIVFLTINQCLIVTQQTLRFLV